MTLRASDLPANIRRQLDAHPAPTGGYKRLQAAAARTHLEDTLCAQLHTLRLDTGMVREYRFLTERKYRADLAWPDRLLLAEVQGGGHTGGRHHRPAGYDADCERMTLAQLAGWRILHVTGTHITSGQACDWIAQALTQETA